MRGEFSVFREKLLRWFYDHRRPLPWRKTPTLYRTVVSEFMLQQTQVDTVIPYFRNWLKRFPDFDALASSSEEEVIQQWQGLGYYSRARNLLKLAVSITQQGIPQSYQEWVQRPGIGPYTAAAISSIAQDMPEPVVDGNVIRVLYRITADATPVRAAADARKKLLPLARKLIDQQRPGDFNEAIMELGATVCRKNNPACLNCPVSDLCIAFADGTVGKIPVVQRRQSVKIRKNRLWLVNDDCLLLSFYPDNSTRLAGLAELPEIQGTFGESPLLVRKRGISSEVITESIYSLEMSHPEAIRCASDVGTRWVSLAEIDSVSLSGPHSKWVRLILESV